MKLKTRMDNIEEDCDKLQLGCVWKLLSQSLVNVIVGKVNWGTAAESGIQLVENWMQVPLKRNPESSIWNPQLRFPYKGARMTQWGCSSGAVVAQRWLSSGARVTQWCRNGGAVVVQWLRNGGAMGAQLWRSGERGFFRVLQFSPLLKNQHFQIPIRSGTHGHISTSS